MNDRSKLAQFSILDITCIITLNKTRCIENIGNIKLTIIKYAFYIFLLVFIIGFIWNAVNVMYNPSDQSLTPSDLKDLLGFVTLAKNALVP